MGMDATAYLFYGFVVGTESYKEEVELPESLADSDDAEGWEEWEDRYARRVGVTSRPAGEYSADRKEDYYKYWEEKREAVKAGGVDLLRLNWCEGPDYALAIFGYYYCGYGSIEEVPDLTIDPEWDEKLKKFCDIMQVPWRQPKWHLAPHLSY